ncbi:MAG: hypothetical protein OXF47_04705 [Nitrospira sp.]|nr:hypothetical protein [Nitrospira sp.]
MAQLVENENDKRLEGVFLKFDCPASFFARLSVLQIIHDMDKMQ